MKRYISLGEILSSIRGWIMKIYHFDVIIAMLMVTWRWTVVLGCARLMVMVLSGALARLVLAMGCPHHLWYPLSQKLRRYTQRWRFQK